MDVYLNFRNQSREAIHFYEEVFQTTCKDLMTFGQMPQDDDFKISEATKDLVLNASLMINHTRVMFSDVPEEMGIPFTVGNNISLVIQSTKQQALQDLFEKLADGGKISMPLQATFWSPLYGMVEDKFKVNWQLNLTEKPSEE